MESMSSNLKVSLPLNVEDDTELTDKFKDSALAITALFKHAQKSRKATFAQGYNSCVSDLRDYIRSNARTSETDRPLTVGAILDFLESRQIQLLRDLDVSTGNGANGANTSTNDSKPSLSRPTKSPSPSTSHPARSVSRNRSPTIKSTSPRFGGQTPSTPNVPPWGSPSLSPTAIVEPAWSDLSTVSVDNVKTNAASSWPEVSVLSVLPLPVSPTTTAILPSAGGKRKRDALTEVDSRNMANAHLHGRHGSRRRRGNSNKAGNQNRINEEFHMDIMDDDVSGRERKRVRG